MALSLVRKNHPLYEQYLEKSSAFQLLLWIIMLKPLVNTFVGMDVIGISISILQVFGFFVIIALLWGLLNEAGQTIRTSTYTIYIIFFIIYIFNLILVVLSNSDLGTIKDFLKILTTPVIFFYYYKALRNEKDLDLIFYAFIVSMIPLSMIFTYDALFVGAYERTRGIDRIETSFGDIATLGLHINVVWIITLYKLLQAQKISSRIIIRTILIFVFSVYSLISIAHGTSFAVFLGISVLFSVFYFRKNFFFLVFLLVFVMVPVFFIFEEWFIVFYDNFYGNEVEALNAGQSLTDDRFFHGRMGRWQRHYELFADQNYFDQFIGGLAMRYPFMIGHGTHNDFLRILFTTGFLGLICYLLFLLDVLKNALTIDAPAVRFLALAGLSSLILFSISLTPSTYIDFNFFLMPAFIFAAKYSKYERVDS
ncbi:MAG: hypothetical protein HEP71_22715 [Roseivirga sp.]|nr:hypothetical protein [Roseivirga sp.]